MEHVHIYIYICIFIICILYTLQYVMYIYISYYEHLGLTMFEKKQSSWNTRLPCEDIAFHPWIYPEVAGGRPVTHDDVVPAIMVHMSCGHLEIW